MPLIYMKRGAYAAFFRALALGIIWYKTRTFPLTSGRLGALVGFTAGFYVDKSATERSLEDNFLAGLAVAAFGWLADVRTGVTLLVPQAWKLGLAAEALTAVALAAGREEKKGRPGSVPRIGIAAVILAFLLVTTAVTVASTIHHTSVDWPGIEVQAQYSDGSSATWSIKANGSPWYVSVPAKTNATIKAVQVIWNSSEVVPGNYSWEVIFTTNVTKPRVTIETVSEVLLRLIPVGSPSEKVSILSGNFTITGATLIAIKSSGKFWLRLDRYDRQGFNDSTRPSSLSFQLSIRLDRPAGISKLSMASAAGLMVIAMIDSLPESPSRLRRHRSRHKSRRR